MGLLWRPHHEYACMRHVCHARVLGSFHWPCRQARQKKQPFATSCSVTLLPVLWSRHVSLESNLVATYRYPNPRLLFGAVLVEFVSGDQSSPRSWVSTSFQQDLSAYCALYNLYIMFSRRGGILTQNRFATTHAAGNAGKDLELLEYLSCTRKPLLPLLLYD